ncbi:MAG: esterase/lipase family protein [Corynebacterium variabile]|uniref:esterase/lipase family protein n=1 Tax=Corynebacterium variabile TaxID=1727 RepID=UPI003F8FA3D4
MGFRTRVTALLASLLVSAGGAVSAPAATAQEVASGTGPALTVDEASLDRSLNCHGDLAGSDRNTVIPLHGTTANVEANWSWTWEPALAEEGRPYCTVELPDNGMQDVQVSAENVTHAIRTVYAESGRKVDLVGHSQGGMIGRWTTKWWPDTRAMVANMVGLGSSNNGSDMISLTCTVACPEAMRQRSSGSDFLTALNEGGDTYPGIRYTRIATRFDEVVAPYDKAFLPPADNVRNIILQDQCPGEPVEHFLLAASNPVWELAVQALDGNPDPRVDPSACQKIMPGVDVAQIPTGLPSTVGTIVGALAGSPWTAAEPPVADYAR